MPFINPDNGCMSWEGPRICYEPLSMIATAASVVGTLVSAVGAISAGDAAEQEAQYKARQLEMKANEQRAAGQRSMFDKQRETDRVQSTLRARAASASGDTTDTGVLNLGGEIERTGEYQALTELYKGENSARGYEDAAAAARFSGENAASASKFRAAGTLLEGGTSLFSKLSKTPSKIDPAYR